MKTRLIISGVVSILATVILAGLSVYSLWQSELELERQIDVTEAVRHELTADMMHDAIEAEVVYGILIGPDGPATKQKKIKAKLAADTEIFRESLAKLQKMELQADIHQMVVDLVPVMEEFITAGEKVAGLAFTDTQAALAALPAFQKQYDALETALEPLGKKIKSTAAETAVAARAHDMQLLYTLLGFSAASVALMVYNAHKVTQTITKPILRLREALHEVANGDFKIRIADRMRADDFGEIAQDIDAVSGRVIKALEEQNVLRAEGEQVIERLRNGLQQLSEGNFSDRINTTFSGDYDALRQNYNDTVDKLNDLLSQVVRASEGIQTQSGEIQSASEELSSRTESQAATLEQTAAALEQMTVSVNSSASNAKQVEEAVETARADVEHSGRVVEGAIAAMNEIEKSSDQISQIIGVIDDIAFQTNLLALNAGVEAARAGEVGRGFAVVASEVRALAQRSSDAAGEIKALISASSKNVEEGVEKVDGAGQALSAVVTQVASIADLVSGISTESAEQAQGLNEINIGVSQLDQVTQQNAAMVEESGAAIRLMNAETETLSGLVGQFTLRGSHAQTPQPAFSHPGAEEYDTPAYAQSA